MSDTSAPRSRVVMQPQPECWRTIGIAGDKTCPELATFIHCRNCPVLAEAARTFFERVGGYIGIDHIASGDDVLLLQKALSDSQARIGFIADAAAIATTAAQQSWRSLWQQRLR